MRGDVVARVDAGSGGGVNAARGRGTEDAGRGGWAGVFIVPAGALGAGRASFAFGNAGGAVNARDGLGGAGAAGGSTSVRSSVATENESGVRAITSVGASSIELLSSGFTWVPPSYLGASGVPAGREGVNGGNGNESTRMGRRSEPAGVGSSIQSRSEIAV